MRSQAINATRFSVTHQHKDGSWDYGTGKKQRWVDNFHTGFNLCSLERIGRHAQVTEFRDALQLGFDFYRTHFFTRDGAPKYFRNRVYPIDIHSAAQSVITLTELSDLGEDNLLLVKNVLGWTVSNMWDQRGYFYFQKHRWGTIKTPYMRWSQAWMLVALVTLEKAQQD